MLERIVSESVEIEFHPGPQELPVRGDPVQLEQVLVNLCVNARDAMGGKGLLRIALGEARPDAAWCATHPGAREVDYATLTVIDTGIGMAPETLSRIFEPFFTTKEVGAGTGLGLSTVYGIVQQHEGFVDVWSQPGQGSRFTVYLPRTEATVPADEAVVRPPAPQGQGTVLVAEDDPGVRQFVTRILTKAGYTVLEAANGLEAVEVMRRHPQEVRVALLDVVMPKLDGHGAALQLRQLSPGIRLIFTSGYDPLALGGGAAADEVMLGKPYQAEDLLHRGSCGVCFGRRWGWRGFVGFDVARAGSVSPADWRSGGLAANRFHASPRSSRRRERACWALALRWPRAPAAECCGRSRQGLACGSGPSTEP